MIKYVITCNDEYLMDTAATPDDDDDIYYERDFGRDLQKAKLFTYERAAKGDCWILESVAPVEVTVKLV